jgi:hypothetical protein
MKYTMLKVNFSHFMNLELDNKSLFLRYYRAIYYLKYFQS